MYPVDYMLSDLLCSQRNLFKEVQNKGWDYQVKTSVESSSFSAVTLSIIRIYPVVPKLW